MAMSQSPQHSPIMEASRDRLQSNSPQPQYQQQISKRDKKRTVLAQRLEEITSDFAANRDQNYRSQLQALQVDMHLIMEANPHDSKYLPNSRAEIDKLVLANLSKSNIKSAGQYPPPRAGRIYADFAKEINDAMEERDACLANHRSDALTRKAHVLSANMYRRKQAEYEHKAMASSIRDRLQNSLSAKKARLQRDKDILEVGESNALLLHPSQFSIANPSSPGGIHGKRSTRHRREADELMPETNKRKRKAHDSDESPAPTRQRTENGAHTPLWQAQKQQAMNSQFGSALFSVDKLFSDKELSMCYNTAALGAYAYMVRQSGPDDMGTSLNGTTESNGESEKPAGAEPEAEDVPSPQGGTGMERTQSTHVTRSRNGFASGYGIDLLTTKDGNFSSSSLQVLARQIPKMPPLLHIMSNRTFTRHDPPASVVGLNDADAAAEIDLIKRARAHNDQHGYGSNLEADASAKAMLEHAAMTAEGGEYWVVGERRVNTTSSQRGDGGADMMRGNSFGGGSMGEAMSRQATGESVKQSSRGRNIKAR